MNCKFHLHVNEIEKLGKELHDPNSDVESYHIALDLLNEARALSGSICTCE